jgi:large subunit ribosomal protein L16
MKTKKNQKINQKQKPKQGKKNITKVLKAKPTHLSFSKRKLVDYATSINKCWIIASSYSAITKQQIEAGRRYLKKNIKDARSINLSVLAFAYVTFTKKPAEVRMGKGKGTKINKQVCPLYPGKIIYIMENITRKKAKDLFNGIMKKIGTKIKLIYI